MDPIDIGLIVAGLVLAFGGAALFKYTVAAIGFLTGGGAGLFVAQYVVPGEWLIIGAVAVIAGLLGVFVTFSMLSSIFLIPGFLIGLYAGATIVGLSIETLSLQTVGATLLGGILGALVAAFAFRAVLPILTGFLGAALASQGLTYGGVLTAADTLDPSPILFDPLAPLFLGIFLVGTFFQYGLIKLGYVKQAKHLKKVTLLGRLFPGRSGGETESAE